MTKVLRNFILGFVVGLPICVWTAWWWFGGDINSMTFGQYFMLTLLHSLLCAMTVASGLGAVVEFLISRSKG